MSGWTTKDMPELEGKTAVVTGANSGIGFEVTKALAEKQAQVVMACRSIERGKNAKEKIEDEVEDPDLQVKKLDLASLESVRDFAEEFKANHESLEILCNNAGVMAIPREETEEGFEKQFGVNHLGHFVLTAKLFPALKNAEEPRVINQSSGLHKNGEINFEDLMHEEDYSPQGAYADSKLANLLFTYELDRKARRNDMDLKSIGCHPGYSATNLQMRGPEKQGNPVKKLFMKGMNKVFAQSAAKGALPMLYAATSDEVESGDYIGPDKLMNMRGYPVKQESSDASYDRDTAEELWAVSEELTETEFEL